MRRRTRSSLSCCARVATVQSACHLVKLLTHPKLPTDRRDEAFRIAAAHDLLDHFDDFDFWGTTPNEAEGAV